MDSLFNFDLPEELIAQSPAQPRDHAKLLIFERTTGKIVDDKFYNLGKYLHDNSTIVVNNTKVNHCRYLFHESKLEIFVVEATNDKTVRALVRPGRKFKLGSVIPLSGSVAATVKNIDEDGIRTIEFSVSRDHPDLMNAAHVPLPPYIEQNDSLAEEYQTIYAKKEGSLAAPTAGLHFTRSLKEQLSNTHQWEEVTLEVGLGTFAPLQESHFASGNLHTESYAIEHETYARIQSASHVTAIGTTTLRTLETVAQNKCLAGDTSIFIRPGYEFRLVDSLVTNFHLPQTSLLLLVEAFLGSRESLERIYRHAISGRYRFYSFGDAMLIL